MITKIWHSVQNCGDRNAYLKLMESRNQEEYKQKALKEKLTALGY